MALALAPANVKAHLARFVAVIAEHTVGWVAAGRAPGGVELDERVSGKGLRFKLRTRR
jgi:hypothetical protein